MPLTCQVDGGLKCIGHPVGASGLRMIYAMYEQLLGRIPEERKVKNARLGLTHRRLRLQLIEKGIGTVHVVQLQL